MADTYMNDLDQSLGRGPRACTTCAKAKAKCIPSIGERDKCERCQRLNKECGTRPAPPPRARKQLKRSRVAELESRLDELSSEVRVSHKLTHDQQQPSQPQSHSSGGKEAARVDAGIHEAAHESSSLSTDHRCPPIGSIFEHLFPPAIPEIAHRSKKAVAIAATVATTAAEAESPARNAVIAGTTPWPKPIRADADFQKYWKDFARIFPFAVLPPHLTSDQVRSQRPFLWKAASMAGCFFEGLKHVICGRELLASICQAAFIDGVKSIDLIQGLQIMIAWFHYDMKGSQLTNLLFLARSLCIDLPAKNEADALECTQSNLRLEGVRAYLATYYLNTLVFTTNKKVDVFISTRYLDDCCNALRRAKQYPSDQYLLELVEIQRMAQTVSAAVALDRPSLTQSQLSTAISSMRTQLDEFRGRLSAPISTDLQLGTHIAIAELLLAEVGLSEQHCKFTNIQTVNRIQLLWTGVRALRSFFDHRFATREMDPPNFICLTASDFAYTVITSIRLLTLRLPGWDNAQVSADLSLGKAIDLQIQDLATVLSMRRKGMYAHGEQEDPLERLQRLLVTVRQVVAVELESREQCAGEDQPDLMQGLVGDLDEEFWRGLVSDTVWDSGVVLDEMNEFEPIT